MSPSKSPEKILIVGMGLAGMCLAYKLHQRGIPFTIIDPLEEKTSSKVAAGMWNPIAFKRLNKVWKADLLLPELRLFYSELEKELGQKLLYDRDIFRIFPNHEAAQEFHAKSDSSDFSEYMQKENVAYESEFGTGLVKQGGYLDLRKALEAFTAWARDKDCLIQGVFEEKSAERRDRGWSYRGEMYQWIITCTGYQMFKSDWWGWLPIRRTKGELLKVRSNIELPGIVNNGKFNLPLEEGDYLCGATYDWSDRTLEPTENGLHQIKIKSQRILGENFEVLEHRVGIRPTVVDRRPLIGIHPSLAGLAVFNGLGARGVMLAPFFSKQLVACLFDNESLDPEVDIRRFN